ncbi:MAG: lipid-A-disaccharide synthase [Mucilaginibacter polytrichastri]|nr:lipid-A-disaccharide synthase [Mucilaginibacter polytrichastri]
MKYYLVAGEASGDLHGANLMKAIRQQDAQAEFRFFGGDKMQQQGGTLVKHFSEMAFMGIVEVVANLRTIRRNMKQCKSDLLAWKPDVLVLIDFPGFNLRIAGFAREHGIPVCYYISPKIWAWNQKRARKIKRVVDRMLCILPFEKDFYAKWDMDVDYVGNPLLDEIAAFSPAPDFTGRNRLNKPIVALLPGSRKQEIDYLLPQMLGVTKNFPGVQFVIAGAPSIPASYYQNLDSTVPVIFDQTYDLLHHADAAIVASGTATLETALFHVPQVVVYKGHPLFIAVARAVIRIGFISLVNLIADRRIVTELIQEECNPERIAEELNSVLSAEGREKMLADYADLDQRMGEPGASDRAATIIIETASALR